MQTPRSRTIVAFMVKTKDTYMSIIKTCLILSLFTLLSAQNAGAAELIVNSENPVRSISKKQLKDFYMLRRSSWDNGAVAVIVALPDQHKTHKSFAKTVLGVFPYKLRRIWDKAIFAGLSRAPIIVDTEEELISVVAKTKGAIGYTNREIKNEKVHKLQISP